MSYICPRCREEAESSTRHPAVSENAELCALVVGGRICIRPTTPRIEGDWVDPEIAITMLEVIPDYDEGTGRGPQPYVHTYRMSAFGLLGAHWRVVEAREAMNTYGVRIAGREAQALEHGLVIRDTDGLVFLQTKS